MIVSTLAQRIALSKYIILKLYYVGNQGSSDVKLQVMKAAMFSVSEVLSTSYNEAESNCEGEEVHAYRGQRLIAPEEVAVLR